MGEHTLTLKLPSWTWMIAFNSKTRGGIFSIASVLLIYSKYAGCESNAIAVKTSKISCVNTSQCFAVCDNREGNCLSWFLFLLIWFWYRLSCRRGMLQGAALCVYHHCEVSNTPRYALERNPAPCMGRQHSLFSSALCSGRTRPARCTVVCNCPAP